MTVLSPKVKKQDGEENGARWAERKPPRDPWRKSRRGNQHGCFSVAVFMKACVRRTSFIKAKPSSLWEWTNVTKNNHCVIFIFFSVYFS